MNNNFSLDDRFGYDLDFDLDDEFDYDFDYEGVLPCDLTGYCSCGQDVMNCNQQCKGGR